MNPPREPEGTRLSVMTEGERANLSQEIFKIACPMGDQSSCAKIVLSVDGALALYRIRDDAAGLHKEGVEKLKDLKRATELVANHLASIDWETASVLAQNLWHLSGMKGSMESAFDDDIRRMRNIAAVAKSMTTPAQKRTGGNHASPAMVDLISHVAMAYAATFGERPSFARNGIFARMLNVIFRASGISNPPNASRLKTILTGLDFVGVPLLRRGRKPKVTHTAPNIEKDPFRNFPKLARPKLKLPRR